MFFLCLARRVGLNSWRFGDARTDRHDETFSPTIPLGIIPFSVSLFLFLSLQLLCHDLSGLSLPLSLSLSLALCWFCIFIDCHLTSPTMASVCGSFPFLQRVPRPRLVLQQAAPATNAPASCYATKRILFPSLFLYPSPVRSSSFLSLRFARLPRS